MRASLAAWVLIGVAVASVGDNLCAQSPTSLEGIVGAWEKRRADATPVEVVVKVERLQHKRKNVLTGQWLVPEERKSTSTATVVLHPGKGWYRVDTVLDDPTAKSSTGASIFYKGVFQTGLFPNQPGTTSADPKKAITSDFVVISADFNKHPVKAHLRPLYYMVGSCPLGRSTLVLPNTWSSFDLREDMDLASVRPEPTAGRTRVLCGPFRLEDTESSQEYVVDDRHAAAVVSHGRYYWTKKSGRRTLLESYQIENSVGKPGEAVRPASWVYKSFTSEGEPNETWVVKVSSLRSIDIPAASEDEFFAVKFREGMKVDAITGAKNVETGREVPVTTRYDVNHKGELVNPDVVVPPPPSPATPSWVWWATIGCSAAFVAAVVWFFVWRRRAKAAE
ncbi:MAG: hypothetical protein MUF18_20025 [Fimbriiglobus sp.]|jgi:hypothetical protein|nr:hypothetical protein [Fimbriiglobus sp.]